MDCASLPSLIAFVFFGSGGGWRNLRYPRLQGSYVYMYVHMCVTVGDVMGGMGWDALASYRVVVSMRCGVGKVRLVLEPLEEGAVRFLFFSRCGWCVVR